MRDTFRTLAVTATIAMMAASAAQADGDNRYYGGNHNDYYDGHGFYGNRGQRMQDDAIQLGPRPFYLVQGMDEGKLKDRLMKCENGPFYRSVFSIGHRGAALQFPEHTKEAYQAGARMGAGIVECDTTFTKDGALVCRHDECDLHTTTNIVATPLNSKCSVPWSGPSSTPKCCTSDLTLSEFKSLKGKMDASNPGAQRLIDEFKAAGIDPRDVWAQSFNKDDILYWIQKEPKFGKQAVYLDSIDPTVTPEIPRLALDELRQLKKQGVQIIAPPIFALLALNANDEIVPSQYALDIKAQGFDTITWTFERADLRRGFRRFLLSVRLAGQGCEKG